MDAKSKHLRSVFYKNKTLRNEPMKTIKNTTTPMISMTCSFVVSLNGFL